MKIKTILMSGVVFSALVLSASAIAQPPEHAQAHGALDKGNAGASRHDRHEQGRSDSRSFERRHADSRSSAHERAHERRPYINERKVRRILQRNDVHQMDSLPPGIRKNLERGKPLPPGIAKRFEGRVVEELPRYPGYERERVGTDVILIDAATRVVVDVLHDALR